MLNRYEKKNVSEERVILFDGVCNLCNGLLNFVIQRDPKATFRFAAIQSPPGQAWLKKLNLPTDDLDSFILIEGDHFYRKSTASLRVLRRLGWFWVSFYALIIIPTPIRDFVYDIIANHRYKWFGKRDRCLIPTPEIQRRFL